MRDVITLPDVKLNCATTADKSRDYFVGRDRVGKTDVGSGPIYYELKRSVLHSRLFKQSKSAYSVCETEQLSINKN